MRNCRFGCLYEIYAICTRVSAQVLVGLQQKLVFELGSEKPESRASLVTGRPALMYHRNCDILMSSSRIISAREHGSQDEFKPPYRNKDPSIS